MKVRKCYECKLAIDTCRRYGFATKVICEVDRKEKSRYSKCTHNYKS